MANERMRELWKVGAEGWVAHRDLFEAELGQFADLLMDAVELGPDDRVLDVGCGTGAVLERATKKGAAGVGVDISPAMVEAATALVPAASFVVADAQTEDLNPLGPFTAVVSRFGVMFFDDPVAAFTNIRRAAAAEATLAFVCWRGIDENPMFTLGTNVLLARLEPKPEPPAADAPGPTAFADPARVRSILETSGWCGVEVTPVDVECDYGRHGTDGVEERLTMILNTTGGRAARDQLESRLGPDDWAALLDDVRGELRSNLVDGRVKFTGATWLVTARNQAAATEPKTQRELTMDVWNAIDAERLALSEDLATLEPKQWNVQSLCTEWKVRDVVGHLVFAANSEWKDYVVGLVKHRGRLNRVLSTAATDIGAASPSYLKKHFAETIGSRHLPPFVKAPCELADIVCHSEDIRRPLGLHRDIPLDTLLAAAAFLQQDRGTGTPKRIEGLQLKATDADWSFGEGPVVEGPLQSLVLVMSGRADPLDELTGEGVDLLRTRLSITS